jgi:hypothetical protein
MHEKMGVPIPNATGVFRFLGEASVEEFLRWAEELQLLNEIRLVSDDEAKMTLGAFYQSGFIHFYVPDTLFKEADLMNKARHVAKEKGVYFRKSDISLIPEPTSPIGFLISTEKERIEPEFVILCAGRGTPSLLGQLTIQHPLAVFQSCLLRIRCGDVMQTPLLVDRSEGTPTSGLSAVQHLSDALPPDGCVVMGNRERRPLEGREVFTRNVTSEEDAKLTAMLPKKLGELKRGRALSAIACAKTEAMEGDQQPSVNPWVESWPEFPGLVAVVPGKATLALFAAYEALKRIEPGTDFSSIVPAGADLSEPFRMHHEHDLDELERTENAEGPWIN